MKSTALQKYAYLIARVGVNVQKGQEVVIQAELDQPEFVRMVAEECYKAGAKKVKVDFSYQPLTRTDVYYCTPEVLGGMEDWELQRWQHDVEVLPCRIYLLSESPDGLEGVDLDKLTGATQHKRSLMKPYRDQMDNKYQWCIAAVPSVDWAKKMFPAQTGARAVEKLWQAILTTSRAKDSPVAAWVQHNRDLHSRCDYLNSLGIETLEYHSANGTDLRVGLIDGSCFRGGSDVSLQGITYNPNIPSEEVFISPRRGAAEGVVYSSKPLSYQGQLIDNFWMRFENGRVTEAHAEKNEEMLKKIIAMDQGAAYLGECALVPYDSPIRSSGLLFYNTLFDENAACHLALGRGFTDTLNGFENLTLAECHARGVNDSIIHEDFMIGTQDLEITAHTRDGRTLPIFTAGNWAF